MVAKIISGKTIRGVLNYNELKVTKGKAEILAAGNFINDVNMLTYQQKFDRFKRLFQQNERTKTNAVHISLNFDKADRLDKLRLEQIAETYMSKIGFGGQPYLVYEHFDASHQHVHIVTTNIEEGGNRIPLHYIGMNQSEQARKEIEIEYGLVKAESKQLKEEDYLKPIRLEKAEYGKSETKAAISNTVREVVRSYKYTSLAELNAALRQYNIVADPGEPGTLKYDKNGLSYCILDKDGNKIGVPIKASKIYGRPILKNLEKRFADNVIKREDYKNRLLYVVDKVLNDPNTKSKLDFERVLNEKNIQIVWRVNKDAKLYGVTYVDNASRTVFNGSDLGKAYSANAISQRLVANTPSAENAPLFVKDNISSNRVIDPGQLLSQITDAILEDENHSQSMDYHLKMTQKKKRRGHRL